MERIAGLCIDTDILIDYLRGLEGARIFLLEVSKTKTLSISVISVVEIYSGSETKNLQKKKMIDLFLQNFYVIPVNMEIARLAGELRRDYQRPFADMIVAASALSQGLKLVTKNTKHFQAIEMLELKRPY